MSASGMPPSSPRLPSPPPPAEIQLGPQSPSASLDPTASRASQQLEQTAFSLAAKRRIHPGTKAADMAAGPPLVALHELDSAFQLQEHLAALHYHHTQSNTVPITRETARQLATPPEGIDKTLWLYELCRFLIAQCNSLIVGFLFDTPPCSAATCPEMRASEWQFLCAVHEAPKSCCAIDYCCHTLDWAANVVTNPKIFPSRFVAPVSDSHDRGAALKNLVNVFRRLHRIFAHAWFQHRGVFWSVEGQNGLYVFFKTVCDTYDLLPAENYKLPPEAEGLEMASATTEGRGPHQQQSHPVVTAIARPLSAVQPGLDEEGFAAAAARTNTRRHIRANPSTGNAISMVPEVDEDDHHGGGAARLAMRNKAMAGAPAVPEPPLSRTHPPASRNDPLVEETETEAAEVPVIVMQEATPILPTRRESQTTVTAIEAESSGDDASSEEESEVSVVVDSQEQQRDLDDAVDKGDAAAAAAIVGGPSQPEESEPEPESESKPEPTPADTEPEPSQPPPPATNSDIDEDAADETIISPTDDEPPSDPFPDDKKDDEVLLASDNKTDEGKLTPDHSDEEGEEPAAVEPAAAAAEPEAEVKEKDLEEAEAKDDAAAAAAVAAAPEVGEAEENEESKTEEAQEDAKEDEAKEDEAKEDEAKEDDAKEDKEEQKGDEKEDDVEQKEDEKEEDKEKVEKD